MNWKGWTILLLVAAEVIWVGYDVAVYIKAGVSSMAKALGL